MTNRAIDTKVITTVLDVPTNHPVFVDHFPGDPLVPGALLIQWLIRALRKECGRTVSAVPSMKFLAPLRPGDCCQCAFQVGEKSVQVTVTQQALATVVCKGKFVLSEARDGAA